ncbi:hypothetical protein EDC04DRAFT_1051049 [Pisolithus marmoratus]|nr:hypothetical protein EDC04DRAFT_1051049 [Pisolithus marmoratus]
MDTSGLLLERETSRTYFVRDFLRFAWTAQVVATVVACSLFNLPSWFSCCHEFLVAQIVASGESLMLIVERAPTNNAILAISSRGGVAEDTITVVRAMGHHDYWKSAGQTPICRGTVRWCHPSPRLLDIGFIAATTSDRYKQYNLYYRQCWWYARTILAVMAEAFLPCSTEGVTSFSRKWLSVLGNYRQSLVQELVELHAVGCRDLSMLPSSCCCCNRDRATCISVGHTMDAESFERSFARLMLPGPKTNFAKRHGDHTSRSIPKSRRYMESSGA